MHCTILYNANDMIKSFKHKGLKAYFLTGTAKGLDQKYTRRIKKVLMYLHAAVRVENMDISGFRLHQHKGDRKGIWSVDVSGNYRIFFKFEDGYAYDVDLGDPH